MTKIFCDSCQREITEENKPRKVSKYDCFEAITTVGKFNRYARRDEDSENTLEAPSGFHICFWCIVDAYIKADNRPKVAPVKQTVPMQESNVF